MKLTKGMPLARSYKSLHFSGWPFITTMMIWNECRHLNSGISLEALLSTLLWIPGPSCYSLKAVAFHSAMLECRWAGCIRSILWKYKKTFYCFKKKRIILMNICLTICSLWISVIFYLHWFMTLKVFSMTMLYFSVGKLYIGGTLY